MPASRQALALALSVLAAACATPGGRAAGLPGSAPACAPGADDAVPLHAPGAVLLLGEIHGVEEFPAFFGEVICAVARSGTPVTAAVELPAGEQGRLDAFVASAGGSGEVAALLASPFWRRDYQDGRSSLAMLAALRRLRELRAAGLAVRVLAFDVDEPGPDRDARMAARLSADLRAHPDRAVVALTGNFHARTVPGAPWDPAWRPMGWFLRQDGAPVRSLDGVGPAGTAWICTSGEAASCGPRPVAHAGPAGAEGGRRVRRLAVPTPEGFDGFYETATVTASPPAAAPARHGGP